MSRRPLSAILPPFVLGTTTFNSQYNTTPHLLPTTAIVHTALSAGITAFDTSPYYGPAESILGAALATAPHDRASYILSTKVGRISADTFDYSPDWVRRSLDRSLERLGTSYVDVVYCHDVEFVSAEEVVVAVRTLRELRGEGKCRYVGISGYPTGVLVELAKRVKEETGEALDAVMSYAHYTLQNTVLASEEVLGRLVGEAGVECVLNGSPLGMGLLRSQGVPVGGMGDFHPAPGELRQRCAEAAGVVGATGGRLEMLALRFSIEGWVRDGTRGGSAVSPVVAGRKVDVGGSMGISVGSVSSLKELEELLAIWADVVGALERKHLYGQVQNVFARDVAKNEWRNYSWPSPAEDYVRGKLE